jgi:hypothetical protein
MLQFTQSLFSSLHPLGVGVSKRFGIMELLHKCAPVLQQFLGNAEVTRGVPLLIS